jgi:5-methyltetrahydropteroyltriglutamate--homocysteine methyltransferase
MARLATTTIGSLFRFNADLHLSIEAALEFQVSRGIDIVSDGEQRADMVAYFAEAFDGLAVESGTPLVTGKISMKSGPEDFSKVKDLDYIRSKHPHLKVKLAISGPTTLGMTCGSRKIKSHYKSIMDFSLYEDIAIALAPIANAIVDRGASVQIDEPFLSQGYKDLEARVNLIDLIAKGLPREKVSVHVCGFVGGYGVVSHLLALENVSTLSFGFAGRIERRNIEHVTRKGFEENDKRLGAGCIAVTPLSEKEVDTPKTVAAKLKEIAGTVGRENIAYAHPDCGMRATNKSLVPIILENMRAGVDLFG